MKRSPLIRRTRLQTRTPIKRVNRVRRARLHADNFGLPAAFIRSLPCIACGAEGFTVPHHVKSRGAGGKSKCIVPLCSTRGTTEGCHEEGGRIGWQSWQEKHGIRLELVTLALTEQRGPDWSFYVVRSDTWAALVEGVDYVARQIPGGGFRLYAEGEYLGSASTLPKTWDMAEAHRIKQGRMLPEVPF